jgi:4-hydroxybenzoate polyprenyltransferase
MCLAGLYTLRLLAGAAAVGVSASFWLLAFSMFLFLSLSLIKRHAELRRHALLGGGRIPRNYDTGDLPVIVAGGLGAGISAVMVLALYIHSDQTASLYDNPDRIWIACPVLLYWILRAWFHATRGQVHEDPVAWAARDPVSWLAAALIVGAFAVAL